MQIEEFTEFFNKKLLLGFLDGGSRIIPISLIETNDYNKLIEASDLSYRKWFNSGKK